VAGADAFYHCMTRTVNGEMLFDDAAKEVLRKTIHRAVDFSGLELVTYCVMGNHFHVLVRVPAVDDPDDAELARRCAILGGLRTGGRDSPSIDVRARLAAGGEMAEALRARLRARMGDVSEFMKTLKQRFSIWFNANHERFGTLWAERFKSVLVEGEGEVLRTMAAYIDLNPARAGLAADPKDYRFCGYAEAVAGKASAVAGLARACGPRETLRVYRLLLFGKSGSPDAFGTTASDRERAARVLNGDRGEISRAEALRCRVRYFTDGVALGSAAFVRRVGAQVENAQAKRPREPFSVKGSAWGDLTVMRGLRRGVYS